MGRSKHPVALAFEHAFELVREQAIAGAVKLGFSETVTSRDLERESARLQKERASRSDIDGALESYDMAVGYVEDLLKLAESADGGEFARWGFECASVLSEDLEQACRELHAMWIPEARPYLRKRSREAHGRERSAAEG